MNKRYLIIFLTALCFIGGGIISFFQSMTVDFSVLENPIVSHASIVLDDEGSELFRFEREKQERVLFEECSPALVNAFVAAEDHNFFKHNGISYKGMLRSLFVNLYNRRVVQGASTITQQVVKLLFLSHERSFKRKIQEVIMASLLERHLTKEQIFEHYLNTIYFGRGIYGVQAACKRFWGITTDQVTLAQAATLAAVAKSARFYSPLNAPAMALQRRNIILRSMMLLGMISHEECDNARAQELLLKDYIAGSPIRLYVQEWIRSWAETMWGKEALYEKGLLIQTTLNRTIQQAAEISFAKIITELKERLDPAINGGLVALEVRTGKIKAFIGGIDFHQSQFNRAFQAVRQVGSAFKPFVYAAAVEQGHSMKEVEVDEPLELVMPNGEVWKPKNWSNTFDGSMTLLRALTTSNNIISVKTLLATGTAPVIALARRCGITRQLLAYPSLALGIAEATVEETAAAFNIFAHHGIYVKPFCIEWVKDEQHKKIWKAEQIKRRVLDSVTASKITHALSFRMRRIERFKQGAESLGVEAIGKTGSTNGSSSTWFVGSTPELTTAVYVGCDDNKMMGAHVFGSQTTFPLWQDFYRRLTFKEKHFYYDSALHEVPINWVTGEVITDQSIFEAASVLE